MRLTGVEKDRRDPRLGERMRPTRVDLEIRRRSIATIIGVAATAGLAWRVDPANTGR